MKEKSSPVDKAALQLRDITRKSRDVRKKIRCEGLVDELQKWQTTLDQAIEQLNTYRDRGYVHDGWLEKTAAAVAGKLPGFLDSIHRAARNTVDEYAWHLDELARNLPDAQGQLSDDEASNNAVIAPLEDHVATLTRVAEDLSHRLREKKELLEPHYRKVTATLRQIGHTMAQFDTSGLRFLPNEHPLRTVDAEFKEASGAGGRIYLTDKRFRFMGIEKKVIKKGFLGIGRETEDILTMLVDEEIGLLQESVDSKKGFIIKDQILTLNWHASAAFQITTFEIKGKAEAWDTLIEDAASGRIDRHRVQGANPPPQPEVPNDIPTQCVACGAGFGKPVVRGMTERVCEYCGHRHPV